MEARDFRGIGRAAQEELRRRALVLIEQRGLSQAQAAGMVGVQRQTVNIWLQRYRAQGDDGVLDGRRVSPRRGKGLLTAEEAGKVQGWIRDRTPDQLKLPFALWTSRAVRDLIALRFDRTLGLSTVQLYLRRWGMTPQKPLARAKERPPTAVAAWLERHYPAIAKRARAEGAAIYWGDETGISNQDQIGRSYAPRGETPVVARTARRITQSMISAVSNRGLMRFMLYEGASNADRFIAFLRRLGKDAGQKVFLIVDNLKVHHAKKVKKWAAAHAHAIELFYLPAYAPDHNPDEYLNNDPKQKLRQQPQPASQAELLKSTRAVLRAIQRSPRRIQAYFTPPPVRYAA
jgi:transposase